MIFLHTILSIHIYYYLQCTFVICVLHIKIANIWWFAQRVHFFLLLFSLHWFFVFCFNLMLTIGEAYKKKSNTSGTMDSIEFKISRYGYIHGNCYWRNNISYEVRYIVCCWCCSLMIVTQTITNDKHCYFPKYSSHHSPCSSICVNQYSGNGQFKSKYSRYPLSKPANM